MAKRKVARKKAAGRESAGGTMTKAQGAKIDALIKKRHKLSEELSKLDQQLAGMGVFGAAAGRVRSRPPGGGKRHPGLTAAGTPRKRPINESNLIDALRSTLSGKTMGVTELALAVQKEGYKTTSPNFRTIVNQTLINNKDKFKRVARGKYTAK